jgi:hypothetical protein
VAAIGPSRRGHDQVVYLASAAPAPVTVSLRVPGLARAAVGTSLERALEPVAVSGGGATVTVPAGGFIAVAVSLGSAQ